MNATLLNFSTRAAPTAPRLEIDSDTTERFLNTIDPAREQFVFQSYPGKGGSGNLAQIVKGSLQQCQARLQRLQTDGACIAVQINEGAERGKAHIKRVRAVFIDTDGAEIDPILEQMPDPNMVVDSSPSRYHLYWLVDDCSLEQFTKVQERLANEFGSDTAVKNLDRVMRLPGSWNLKYAQPFQLTCDFRHEQVYAMADIESRIPQTDEYIPSASPPATGLQIPEQIPEGERTSGLVSYVGRLAAKGKSAEDIRDQVIAANMNLCVPPLSDQELETQVFPAIERFVKEDLAINLFNQNHAIVRVSGKTVVVNEDTDNLTFSEFNDFRRYYAHLDPVNVGQDQTIPAADHWLKHCQARKYREVDYRPGEAGHPDGKYNLWRGWSVEPKTGDCGLYLDHIRKVICQGDTILYNYVEAWMADAVQNPQDRPGVALVMKGGRGTGKGIYAKFFGELFGPHYLHITQSSQLVGRFNAHMKAASLAFVDEAYWAGNRQAEGTLKGLITEDHIMLEAKGVDAFKVRNHMSLMFASNEDWVVPAGFDERRFLVLEVSEQHKQDHAYFSAIVDQMKNQGGVAALMDHLLKVDLSGVNLRDVPQTRALLEQKLESLDSFGRFWYSTMVKGEVGGKDDEWENNSITASTSSVYEDYQAHAKEEGVRHRASQAQFGKHIKKYCPSVSRRKVKDGISRCWHYDLPSLPDCRRAFEKHLGAEIDWDRV